MSAIPCECGGANEAGGQPPHTDSSSLESKELHTGTASTKATIQHKLTCAFQPSTLTVQDQSDACGAKFQLLIVADAFQGLNMLERHRAVNDALASEIPGIHALSMKTYTPSQYDKKKAQGSVLN